MTNEEIREAIKLGKRLERTCSHDEIIHTGVELWGPDEGSIKCAICGKDLGWWCPVSENHMCEYFGIHDEQFPEEEDYNDDDCIYCHQPEERK